MEILIILMKSRKIMKILSILMKSHCFCIFGVPKHTGIRFFRENVNEEGVKYLTQRQEGRRGPLVHIPYHPAHTPRGVGPKSDRVRKGSDENETPMVRFSVPVRNVRSEIFIYRFSPGGGPRSFA